RFSAMSTGSPIDLVAYWLEHIQAYHAYLYDGVSGFVGPDFTIDSGAEPGSGVIIGVQQDVVWVMAGVDKPIAMHILRNTSVANVHILSVPYGTTLTS